MKYSLMSLLENCVSVNGLARSWPKKKAAYTAAFTYPNSQGSCQNVNENPTGMEMIVVLDDEPLRLIDST
jgi:hypothetical protein